MKLFVRRAMVVLGAALLVACAANPTPPVTPEPDTAGERAAETPRNDENRGDNRHADERPQLFPFDKMSVSLSEGEKANVAAFAERARNADSILIRGYCDRTEVGNAKDAAIARAQAVRKVLLKAGVPARSMRVRYNTERKMHAAEVELQ
ncbi:OmpA family protein [Aromatoleum sp.]|uniref:OmpA family protein n=1 Tax=Aromatoleum sp. TaxID=2307007 RepID=UPI002FC6160A